MRVVVDYPPNYNTITGSGLTPSLRAVFCYGDTIYNPSGGRVSRDVMAHEEVHMLQQKISGPDAWWRRYMEEPEFRLDQEVRAYGRQYQFICSENPNRNFQFQVLQAMALTLCGPMYGFVTSQENAMRLITTYA